MKRLQQLITFLIALISSNALSAYGSSDRRRISHNLRQLQLVLDTPLETESGGLSYANEEDEDLETMYEEDSLNAADDKFVEEDDSFFGDDLIIEEDTLTSEPVETPVPPTSAPTESLIGETFESTTAPTKSLVAETFRPTHTPTKQNALETAPPSPAPTESIVTETASPTLVPTKSWVFETPRPSPTPTMTRIMKTPSPSQSPTQSPIHRKHRTSSPSQSPTQSPIKKKHPRTERPTVGGKDSSKPDDYDMWGNDLDGTFSHHATASPATSSNEEVSKSSSDSLSKNHALEKEAEEFVEDPYVRVATLVFAVVSVTLLILVAQQMVENPDGFCARLCRWTVAFFRMLCYPCLLCLCCGSRSKAHHTHTLVSTDGFDDYDHDLSLA